MMSTTLVTGATVTLALFLTTGLSVPLATFQAETLSLLVVGFIIAFILAFAVGANDVANSFGTTVGAKTLTLRQACILASVFETLGAILLGAKVGETIRKGIIDANIYRGQEHLLMVGEVSAMIGSGLWQLVATFLKLPVSGTHSIVGATVGFSLVAMGFQGVNWKKMGLIVASWFISPILAGLMAALFYMLLKKLIFLKDDPVVPGLIAMPILYGCAVAINFFSVFYSGAPLLGFNAIPLWGDFVIALLLGVFTYLIVRLVVVVRMEKSIRKAQKEESQKALLPMPVNNHVKKTAHTPALEPISEKEPLSDSEDGKHVDSSNNHKGSASTKEEQLEALRNSPRKTAASSWSYSTRHQPSNHGEAKGPIKRLFKQQSAEDAVSARTQTGRVRSHSSSEHSSVRIPALLQLEQKVLKTKTARPTVSEIKEGIRKNFSEPSMLALTENVDGDFFEVHINRRRRAVTIQRKRRASSRASESSASNLMNGRLNSIEKPPKAQSAGEMDALLDGVPNGNQIHLEEPFDDSDDEGPGLQMNTASAEPDVMVVASDQTSYTGAIEVGFRQLSTTHATDIIEIKVAQDEDCEIGEKKIGEPEEDKEDRMEVRKIFSFLQILTACFGAFAHGGNDVSNAIGPLIALYIIYSEGSVDQTAYTPVWILLYGGAGICVGLWVWGRRVIKTMGEDLTSLTPSRGFTIELMSGVTVLAASNVGIPVSTTHCKVGAVVSVGWVRSREAVDWKIFRNIVLAWFVTVPVSGGLSAVVFLIMRHIAGV